MFHVLVSDSLSDAGLSVLRADDVRLTAPGKMARSDVLAAIEDADALIVRSATQADRELIERGTALKVIGRAGVGVDNIDVAAATAWRQGRLIVRDLSLSEVVAEINRYREHPIRIADTRIGQQRVTASFLLDEQSAVLQALQQILPLQAKTQDDGSVLLSSVS